MMEVVDMNAESRFQLLYRIDFTDGGEPEFGVIQRDLPSLESCKELAKLLPAITYKGDRPVKEAQLVWGPQP